MDLATSGEGVAQRQSANLVVKGKGEVIVKTVKGKFCKYFTLPKGSITHKALKRLLRFLLVDRFDKFISTFFIIRFNYFLS